MLSEATSVSRMTRRTSGDVRVAHLSQIGEELFELRVVEDACAGRGLEQAEVGAPGVLEVVLETGERVRDRRAQLLVDLANVRGNPIARIRREGIELSDGLGAVDRPPADWSSADGAGPPGGVTSTATSRTRRRACDRPRRPRHPPAATHLQHQ
ncbi:MAG: hypothetical protein V7633_897 [Pseudonocardia sp.]|jgi:hypothetical protein